jgi:phosphopantetheinyl transferase
LTYIYVSAYPFEVQNESVFPGSRALEIQNTRNVEYKSQKFFAWKLLEKLIAEKTSVGFSDINFSKSENGKWICDKFHFSVSHTKNVCAVAVSDKTLCGIDIEEYIPERFDERLAKKILTAKELAEYEENEDKQRFVIQKWTEKESIFKMLSQNVFIPKNIATSQYKTKTFEALSCFITVALSDEDETEITIM